MAIVNRVYSWTDVVQKDMRRRKTEMQDLFFMSCIKKKNSSPVHSTGLFLSNIVHKSVTSQWALWQSIFPSVGCRKCCWTAMTVPCGHMKRLLEEEGLLHILHKWQFNSNYWKTATYSLENTVRIWCTFEFSSRQMSAKVSRFCFWFTWWNFFSSSVANTKKKWLRRGEWSTLVVTSLHNYF